MTLDELLALLPDNESGDITAADLRTIVTELYAPQMNEQRNVPGPYSLPVTANFVDLPPPGPLTGLLTTVESGPALVSFSAYMDSGSNNNNVSLGIDLSGATNLPAGAPGQVLRVGGKQPVQGTISLTYLQEFNEGDTVVAVEYKASATGAIISDLSLSLVSLFS